MSKLKLVQTIQKSKQTRDFFYKSFDFQHPV